MPRTPFEIMAATVWANGLAVLGGVAFALIVVVQQILGVPIVGSIPLFLAGVTLYLFTAASMGIFLATLARSMPQFGLLIILTIVPLQMLSGGVTPRESMPLAVQYLMSLLPNTYFVRLAQAILYRGAGIEVVWVDFLAMALIGVLFFVVALRRFRAAVAQTEA
jgi:ABC-2 type transport system permease protein